MTLTTVNGKVVHVPEPWPPIDEAMRLLEADLHHKGSLVKLSIRQVTEAIFYGRMWQEVPEGISSDLYQPGDVLGEITAHATTQQLVVRQLAAIIQMYRPQGAPR